MERGDFVFSGLAEDVRLTAELSRMDEKLWTN
jgi:hypothetical protein